MSKQPTYTATITFTSGETIDDDNHLSVLVSFDPPEAPEGDFAPPAYVIARKVFLENVREAINDYLEELEREPEYEYVPVALEDQFDQEEQEEDDDYSEEYKDRMAKGRIH
jgi:hypothetical protein